MDCSPPGSSVHGILQARILEWVAFPFSRGSSQPGTQVSRIMGGILYQLSHREARQTWVLSHEEDWVTKNWCFWTAVLVKTLPWWLRWKSICLQRGRPGFSPWVGKTPWRRKLQPTLILLPGKFHGLRSLVGYSPWGCKKSDTTERLHFTWELGINLSDI